MALRSLLVAVDLSPGTDRVLRRVERLPLAEDARVTLLHVVPASLSARVRQRAARDAKRALAVEVESLARTLGRSIAIRDAVKTGAPADGIAAHARAAKAELVVMGRGRGRAIRDVFLGSTAERVVRQGKVPVLLVRRPAHAPYRRPALALDCDQAASPVVALLLRVMAPPRPPVALIHAYHAPFDNIVYPSLSREDAEAYRDRHGRRALRDLANVLATGLAQARISPRDAPTWNTRVRYGDARAVIERTVREIDADLLALGTHGYAGVAHAFLGTVAGDVLRHVACDVLIVPPHAAAARKL